MSKFTTKQLKEAMIELYATNNTKAYQLAFDELESRLSDEDFDKFLAAFDKMPESRTRKEHLQVLETLKRDRPKEFYSYWLKYCPRISIKVLEGL